VVSFTVSRANLVSIGGPCLRILVGQGERQQPFWIHEDLLKSHSEFFKRAAKAEWSSDSNRTISLPDDDPGVFQMYAALTYSGVVTPKDWLIKFGDLVKIYVLAEKLQDVWAKNHIIDAMHNRIAKKLLEKSISLEEACKDGGWLDILYEGTPSGSPARRLVVDLVSKHATTKWLEPIEFVLRHHEFLFEVTVRLLKDRSSGLSTKKLVHPSTHYHEKLEATPLASDAPKAKNTFEMSKASPAETQTVQKPKAELRLPQSVEQAPESGTVPRYDFSLSGGGTSRT